MGDAIQLQQNVMQNQLPAQDLLHAFIGLVSRVTKLGLPFTQLFVLALDGVCCCPQRLVLKHVIQLLRNLLG